MNGDSVLKTMVKLLVHPCMLFPPLFPIIPPSLPPSLPPPQGTCNGSTGYFPASYVQTVSQGNHIMQALYDFTPQGLGDLVLEEGQVSV